MAHRDINRKSGSLSVYSSRVGDTKDFKDSRGANELSKTIVVIALRGDGARGCQGCGRSIDLRD